MGEKNERREKRTPTLWRLAGRSISYRWRVHLALAAGAALSAGIVSGAALVGDSVRKSLLSLAERRLGPFRFAAAAPGFLPRAALAAETAAATGRRTAAILPIQSPVSSDAGKRFPDARIIGISAEFADLNLKPGEAALSSDLAETLEVSKGDSIMAWLSPPTTAGNSEIAWAGLKPKQRPARLKVARILDPTRFPGSFSLRSRQATPMNVFVPLSWLTRKTGGGLEGRCAVILASGPGDATALNAALSKSWTPADAGLSLEKPKPKKNAPSGTTGKTAVLPAFGFFLGKTAEAALEKIPGVEIASVYFADSIRHGSKECPYSFIAGIEGKTAAETAELAGLPKPPPIPKDAIIVTKWLADDLGLEIGDNLRVHLRVPVRLGGLSERAAEFRVAGIVPTGTGNENPLLAPRFPGLTDAEKCSEWKPGKIVDLAKVRKKDEDYWNEWRALPKAFISVDAAKRLWKNDFGFATAALIPKGIPPPAPSPDALGFNFRDIAENALENAENAVDFGGLFLALSFFAIFSGVLLVSALFSLMVESRRGEMEIERRLGFSRREIRAILLLEGGASALLGALAGIPLGILYNHLTIAALNTEWLGAVGTPFLEPSRNLGMAAAGATAGLAASLAALLPALPKKDFTAITERDKRQKNSHAYLPLASGWLLLAAATATAILGRGVGDGATAFFVAGAMALAGSWCLTWALLKGAKTSKEGLSRVAGEKGLEAGIAELAYRGAGRNPKRSLVSIILPSCGVFLVVSVAMNRRTEPDTESNASGTGGYALFAETAAPIAVDLNTKAGRAALGLPEKTFARARFLQCRLAPGDEASCLNLNRVSNPAALGVDFAELARGNRFSFAKTADTTKKTDAAAVWRKLLEASREENTPPPCVADDEAATWSLKKKLGDEIALPAEKSARLDATLRPSVFQGFVLIPRKNFEKLFPDIPGTRIFLVDIPKDKADAAAKSLERHLASLGCRVEKTSERLARFRQVENTYLSIFLAIGGLGIAIGALGFGIMAARNALERRGEFAALAALGFRRKDVKLLFLIENAALATGGVALGTLAAAIAAIPAVVRSGHPLPYGPTIALILAILATAILSIKLAAETAIPKP